MWKSRNDLFFKGKEYEARSVLTKASEDAEEWQGRKTVERSEAERTEVKRPININQDKRRVPPPKSWLKCNSDGAWHKDREISGLGWICRDENGNVLWAGAGDVTRAASAILAEAEAFKWGVEIMAGFGYKNIIFESNSLPLVKMINGNEEVSTCLCCRFRVLK